ARWLLLQAAARQLGVPADQLRCEAGHVIAGDGRRLGYGALAEAAAKIAPPKVPVPLKTPDRFTLIGRGAGDADARAVVTGQARFGIDHASDDALVAVLAHCPWPDGSLDRIGTAKALAVKGVVKVLQLGPERGQPLGTTPRCASVAVVAENTWAALQGRAALELKWKPGAGSGESTAAIEQQAEALLGGDNPPTQRLRDDGNVDSASKRAARRIEASYMLPWLAHATAEPANCFARIEKDRAELVVPTQAPQQALAVVQRLTGLSPARITLRVPRVGGGYGRRLDHDYVAEAVMLGKMLDKPVRLLWTREDDLTHDFYRSGSVHAMQAIVGRKRQLLAWNHRFATAPALAGRGVPDTQWGAAEANPGHLPAGLVPNFRLDWFAVPATTPRGPHRGMPDTAQAFAVESFLDEIAHVMRENPLDTRLRVIGEPRQLPLPGGGTLDTGRLARVLKLAAERIDWPTWLHTVNGLGIATWYMDGAYVAHAVEASMKGEQLTVERVVCVADIGRAINPTGLQGQLAGATLDALGQALGQAVTIKDGQVQQPDWKSYGMASMAQLPDTVEVVVIADNDRPPAGASFLAMPTAAPALANAVFRATAVRVRRLPLMRELLRLL
ncbi:MAG: molybdopterin-dependent oxidoreductase, partial [Xanthomonadaceae bacterium]|nr:molybdopterin-dependent oxidoreductase [Xanthomonadaceae bacterium]